MVQHILFLTENECFYLCIICSLLTMMYTFKQEIQLATKNFFTYTVQYPEVHHRTGSTSVLKQFSSVFCSLPANVGKYCISLTILT